MFYLKFKIVRTCDFCDVNPLKGIKINSRQVMKEITFIYAYNNITCCKKLRSKLAQDSK